MKCPCCECLIEVAQVNERQSQGLGMRLRCPHCDNWLAVNGRATLAKLAGVVALLAGAGVMVWGAERTWILGAGLCMVGGVLAVQARQRELVLQPLKPGVEPLS